LLGSRLRENDCLLGSRLRENDRLLGSRLRENDGRLTRLRLRLARQCFFPLVD
jgi:hypothetical protein